jgi:hypothetical protein
MCWRGVCIGFIGLLILAPITAGGQSALPPAAIEDSRGERDDRPPAVQKWLKSAEELKRQVREQTVLRAFFERPEVPCFVLNGLLKLGAGTVEFVYAAAKLGRANGIPAPVDLRESIRFVSFHDGRCAVGINIFKEVVRSGQRRRLGPLAMLEHQEWPPTRPGIDVYDIPGDRIDVSGQGFPNDPEPACIMREGLFAVTPSGFQIAFRGPPHALPFDVDQYVLPDRRRVVFEFTTSTCRLVFEVEKYIGEARLAPVE